MGARAWLRSSGEPLALRGTWAIVAGGLVVGAVLGFGANFLEEGGTQNVLYALSAAGLIVASVLLAVEHVTAGNVVAAAGFAVLALGETRILNPVDVPGGDASFAAGVLLYAPALLLIALSAWPPLWARVTGVLAAVLFAAHALAYMGGADVDSTDPLAGLGYALLTLTIVGWVLEVLRSRRPAA